MTKKKTTKAPEAKKAEPSCACACCCAAGKSERGIKETAAKIGEIVKKIPGWLKRLQAELKQLIERLAKLDAELDRLNGLIGERKATADDKANFKLLTRQRKAMSAYRAVLEERVAKAEKDGIA